MCDGIRIRVVEPDHFHAAQAHAACQLGVGVGALAFDPVSRSARQINRVVADTAWDPLPSVAVAAARTDGSVNVMKSVFGAITRPWQIPALIRLGTRTNRARKTLQALADLGLARGFFV